MASGDDLDSQINANHDNGELRVCVNSHVFQEGEHHKEEHVVVDDGHFCDQVESLAPRKNSASDAINSRVRSGLTPNKQSLPSVLAQYGLKAENKERRKKVTRNKSDKSQRDDGRREISTLERDEKNRVRDMKLHQMFSDPERGRGYMYEDYMANMNKKLSEQREDIERKTQMMEQELKRRGEKLKNEMRQARKNVMQRFNFVTDNTFKTNIHISKYGKILELQDKLVQDGKLKSVADVDAFRTDMMKEDIFEAHFGRPGVDSSTIASVSETNVSHHSSHPSLRQNHDRDNKDVHNTSLKKSEYSCLHDQPRERHLKEIDELSEASSRPYTSEKINIKALKILNRINEKGDDNSKQHQELDPREITSKNARQEFEKRYAKVEMPDLYCYKLDLEEPPPDPVEVQRKAELQAKVNQRWNFVKKLKRMSQLAISHRVASTRILEKHADELALLMGGPNLKDLTESYNVELNAVKEEARRKPDIMTIGRIYKSGMPFSPIAEVSEPPSAMSRPVTQPIYKALYSLHSEPISSGNADYEIQQGQFKARSRMSRPSATPSEHTCKLRPPGKHPLTMNAVLEHDKVLEAKCMSSFWSNYKQAGKSLFSKV